MSKEYKYAVLDTLGELERDLEGQLETISAALNVVRGLDEDLDQHDLNLLDRHLSYSEYSSHVDELKCLLDEKEQAEEEEEEEGEGE